MSGHRDPVAGEALAHVTKRARVGHAPGCWVNGGPKRHGVRGYLCPACAPRDQEAELLTRLDRLAGGWS